MKETKKALILGESSNYPIQLMYRSEPDVDQAVSRRIHTVVLTGVFVALRYNSEKLAALLSSSMR